MVRSARFPSIVVLFVLTLSGCTDVQSQSGRPATGTQDSGPAARRFQDPPLSGRTTVESAIELSEKYAKLSDQAVTLREENQRLTSENQNLQQQVASIEGKLKQTQKELNEANALLIDMLTELNNWKSNILGFRGEMREASKAQLEALLKILEVLGGEAEAGTLERRHAGTLSPDRNDVPRTNPPATSVKNEPNTPQR